MNRIQLETGGFPLTTQTFDFLQESYGLIQELTKLGAEGNYILSGMFFTRDTETHLSDGILVYNGEIFPFIGGSLGTGFQNAKQLGLTLIEDKETVIYEDDSDGDGTGDEKEAYIRRYFRLGNDGIETINYYSLERFTSKNSYYGKVYIAIGTTSTVRDSATGDFNSITLQTDGAGFNIYRISFPNFKTSQYTPIINIGSNGSGIKTLDYNIVRTTPTYFDIIVKEDVNSRSGYIYELLIQLIK